MHENIEYRIEELKEIALQIINLTESKYPYAYGYLTVLTTGELAKHAKYYNRSLAEAYEVQILYVLSNLEGWRGSDARHYKALLKTYLKYFQGKINTGKLRETTCPM